MMLLGGRSVNKSEFTLKIEPRILNMFAGNRNWFTDKILEFVDVLGFKWGSHRGDVSMKEKNPIENIAVLIDQNYSDTYL